MTKIYYVFKKEIRYVRHYVYRNEKQKDYDYYEYDNCNTSESVVKETEWECIGYCENATEVFDYLMYRKVINKYVDYILPLNLIKNKNANEDIIDKYINDYYYFTDDKYCFKTLDDIKYGFKKRKRKVRINRAFQRKIDKSNMNEKRQSITPYEISEIKNDYGIQLKSIKNKRNFDASRWKYYKKTSKSWKKQSKRKHQYKI